MNLPNHYKKRKIILITSTILALSGNASSSTTNGSLDQSDYHFSEHSLLERDYGYADKENKSYLKTSELDYYQQEAEPNKKSLFLIELIQDFYSLDTLEFEDDDLEEKSFKYALEFVMKMPESLGVPAYDIHPDGEFSLVWRKDGVGIFAISFSTNGEINYASYSPSTNIRHKGLLSFNDLLFHPVGNKNASEEDTILFTLINKFS